MVVSFPLNAVKYTDLRRSSARGQARPPRARGHALMATRRDQWSRQFVRPVISNCLRVLSHGSNAFENINKDYTGGLSLYFKNMSDARDANAWSVDKMCFVLLAC